jgi:hypothetical protein
MKEIYLNNGMEWVNALAVWNIIKNSYNLIGFDNVPFMNDDHGTNQYEYFIKMQEYGVQFYSLTDNHNEFEFIFISLHQNFE